jgi:small conductance mechanosensitive channel
MILEDQYGVGDVIDLGEATGTVEGVGLRVTRLRDVNGPSGTSATARCCGSAT